jgi:hypothetical protein
MADALNYVVALLDSGVAGMQNGDPKTTIYTVPPGKKAILIFAVVRNPTASLAAGTDFDFGDGANADTWVNAVDLSSMTAATDSLPVSGLGAKYTILDAGDEWGIKPVTGATADADAIIDLFGYEYNA